MAGGPKESLKTGNKSLMAEAKIKKKCPEQNSSIHFLIHGLQTTLFSMSF
jgi:hypothetical protein